MNKSPNYWAELIERYYAGETSLEEEAALRRYWLETDPESKEAQLAAYFEAAAQQEDHLAPEAPSAAFSEQSFAAFMPTVSAEAANEPRLQKVSSARTKGATYRWMRPLLAVAATVALLMVSFRFWPADTEAILAEGEGAVFPLAEETDWSKYEVTDPDEALAILAGSLRQVAEPLRAGARAASPMNHLSKLTNPLPR
ncbi:MAG: hypothetical protein AAF433_09560 [Bacteroidota bacterium]